MMRRLGIVSGTLSLRGRGVIDALEEREMENEFGRAVVLVGESIAFIPRHGSGRSGHVLPHLINHQANFKALKDLGVDEIIAVHSTGSMKKHLMPGMLVIPGDFIKLTSGPTLFRTEAVHVVPALSEEVRRKWMDAARDLEIEIVDGGIYWQTAGPRFETRAEIAMMARYADLVGMTMASEAVIASELGLAYASLCSVDNYAHGIEEGKLTMAQVTSQARRNAERVSRIVERYVERRGE